MARYALFYRCRMCGVKFQKVHTDTTGNPPTLILASWADQAPPMHQCAHGDVGLSRLIGLRPEQPAREPSHV
jgi:hypothetical protein